MLDFLAYGLFLILVIGFLRYAMRDVPREETSSEATSADEGPNKR